MTKAKAQQRHMDADTVSQPTTRGWTAIVACAVLPCVPADIGNLCRQPIVTQRCTAMLVRRTTPYLLAAVVLMCAACGGSPLSDSSPAPSDAAPQSAPDPTRTPSPTPTPVPAITPEPTAIASTPAVEAADVEMDSFIRGLTFDYWDAFNAYEADTVFGLFRDKLSPRARGVSPR